MFIAHDSEHTLLDPNADRTGPFTAGNTESESNPQWIHEQLMYVDEYRIAFEDRIQQDLAPGGALTVAADIARHTELTSQLTLAIIAESARWGDARNRPVNSPFTQTDWQNAVNTVNTQFFPQRQAIFLAQLQAAKLLNGEPAPLFSTVGAPGYNQQGGVIQPGFQLSMNNSSGTIYYTLDGTDPRLVGGGVNPHASIFVSATTTSTLVAKGSVWKYKDDNSDQGTAWEALGFNDNTWASGPAELGYGDGDEATVVNSGPDNNHYTTTYFRSTFSITNLSQLLSLNLSLVRDDGAVVYINGQEVWRSNMPSGTINYQTPSATIVGGSDESTFFSPTDPIPTSMLINGTNEIAVEIHQSGPTSSDISFNLQLTATFADSDAALKLNGPTIVKARALSNGVWSALNEADFTLAAPPALKITELNYNPQARGAFSGDNLEFIELMNTGATQINLQGISIALGISYTFGNVTLAGNTRIVVAANRTAIQTIYGNSVNLAPGVYTGKLSNGGEEIQLLDADGSVLQDFTYGDSGDWPGVPMATGARSKSSTSTGITTIRSTGAIVPSTVARREPPASVKSRRSSSTRCSRTPIHP